MTNNQEPKRRWLQYSVRTLLVIVALRAIPSSCYAAKAQPLNSEREAASGD
jgi:hypothetical protein